MTATTPKNRPLEQRPLRLDIQDKLALGIAAVFTAVAAAGLVVVQGMVSRSIANMDENSARQEAARVMGTLTSEVAVMLQSGSGVPAKTWVSDDDLRALGRKTGSYVALFRSDAEDLTQVQRRAVERLRAGETVFLDRRPSDQWVVYSLVSGPVGRPPVLVRATIRSPQSAEVTVTMHYAGMLLLALAAVVLVALIVLVRWMVVKPIRTLTRNVVEIGSSADLTRRVSLRQDDEIGALSREFDRMLDQLAGAQRSLMAYSFQAGAQDAAVQALHDIGNAATPVTVSLDLLRESLHDVDATAIAQRLDDLRNEQDPSRRQALLDCLQRDVSALQEAVMRVREQLTTAIRHSGRIDTILRRSDRGSAPSPGPASVATRDLVATAVSMLRPDDRAGISIELDSSLDRAPDVAGTHPGLYAVFHSILTNAVEAIRAAGVQGRIIVRGESNTPSTVMIRITDNGIGIPPQTNVFDRDFTTKDRPKTMFNLHWCAGVIAACKGKITIESEGRERGTVATVSLPCSQS